MFKAKNTDSTEPTTTPEEALVKIWNGIMASAKKGDSNSKSMLINAGPEVRNAYAKVYGDNVIPFFTASRHGKAA